MAEASLIWNSQAVFEALGLGAPGAPTLIRGFSIDSRTVQHGDVFVALKGARDGHDFVPEALAKGASFALVDTPQALPQACQPHLIVVPAVLPALNTLAQYARDRCSARRVGITGSVGKTSLKELTRHMLGAITPQVAASAGNFNNHIGLPLSLLHMPPDSRYGVFELGMSKAGEIAHLSTILQPHIGVITNIMPAHMAFFNDIFEVADAKAEMAYAMTPDSPMLLHHEGAHYHYLADKFPWVQSFGFSPHADAKALRWEPARISGTQPGSHLTAQVHGQTLDVHIPHPGRHWALTALAGLLLVSSLGEDVQRAAAAIPSLPALPGRAQLSQLTVLHQGQPCTIELWDESYNSSPASVKAMLETFAQTSHSGRKIIVLGDMLELGDSAVFFHEALVESVQQLAPDMVITTGPLMHHLHRALQHNAGTMALHHCPDSASAFDVLREHLRQDDCIAVKGSLGSAMGVLVRNLRAMSQAPC